jgi:hypothetical protein
MAPPASAATTTRRAAGVGVLGPRLHIGVHDHADRFFPTWNTAVAGLHVPAVVFVVMSFRRVMVMVGIVLVFNTTVG